MKYIISSVVFLFVSILSANESYPMLFQSQGIPLFKASKLFVTIKSNSSIKDAVDEYKTEVKRVKEIGFSADISMDKKEKMIYLKALRVLQKKYDTLMNYLEYSIKSAIRDNNYKEFLNLVNNGINSYKDKENLKEKILSFYKKNKTKGKIASLEKLIREEKNVVKYYAHSENSNYTHNAPVYQTTSKEIILLSMSGCSYCTKAKALLNSSGKSYKELNVKSGQGTRLYKKHNGTGLPIIIVDGTKVIRGYSKERILREIQ